MPIKRSIKRKAATSGSSAPKKKKATAKTNTNVETGSIEVGNGTAAETSDPGTQTIISYVNASTQTDNGIHLGMQTAFSQVQRAHKHNEALRGRQR